MKKVKIQTGPGAWVNGFDGKAYEVTINKRKAWQMSREDAERRLPKIQAQFPDAKIV